VLTFCFFLFNDKKMARPAGQNQLAVPAKKTLGASRIEKIKGRAIDNRPHKIRETTNLTNKICKTYHHFTRFLKKLQPANNGCKKTRNKVN